MRRLHLHALGTPLEEVVERFMAIAFFEEFPARREVDPGNVRPDLPPLRPRAHADRGSAGRLRDEESEGGRAFSLAEFHDRLLRQALPLPLAREALLPLPGEEEAR
jgi:hypothetical protein